MFSVKLNFKRLYVNQRIGRTLRKNDGVEIKDKSIVIIYEHNARFLSRHALKVRKILKREKEFVLLDSKGPDFICDEIRDLLGMKKQSETMFD